MEYKKGLVLLLVVAQVFDVEGFVAGGLKPSHDHEHEHPKPFPVDNPFCFCEYRGRCGESLRTFTDLVLRQRTSQLVCGSQFELCCNPNEPWPPIKDEYSHLLPCVPDDQCRQPYGTRPTDVRDYGSVPPCPGLGAVRCVDGKQPAVEEVPPEVPFVPVVQPQPPPPGPTHFVIPIVNPTPPLPPTVAPFEVPVERPVNPTHVFPPVSPVVVPPVVVPPVVVPHYYPPIAPTTFVVPPVPTPTVVPVETPKYSYAPPPVPVVEPEVVVKVPSTSYGPPAPASYYAPPEPVPVEVPVRVPPTSYGPPVPLSSYAPPEPVPEPLVPSLAPVPPVSYGVPGFVSGEPLGLDYGRFFGRNLGGYFSRFGYPGYGYGYGGGYGLPYGGYGVGGGLGFRKHFSFSKGFGLFR